MVDLSQRAMLVTLMRSQWGGEKTDRRVSAELTEQKMATTRSARVVKSLLPPEALAQVHKASGEARRLHYRYTLPWRDSGPRILRSAIYDEYIAAMRDARHKCMAAEEDFYSKYDVFSAKGKAELGEMVDDSDYPSLDEVKAMFAFELDVAPLPAGSDFRCEISGAEAIKAEIDECTLRAAQGGVQAKLREAAGLIEHMAERLRAYTPGQPGQRATGTFRDSLVENVQDLAVMLPKLNLFEDPEIDSIANDIRSKLASYHPQELRDFASHREAVSKEADDILERLAGYL